MEAIVITIMPMNINAKLAKKIQDRPIGDAILNSGASVWALGSQVVQSHRPFRKSCGHTRLPHLPQTKRASRFPQISQC
jgi:hypothetical protein